MKIKPPKARSVNVKPPKTRSIDPEMVRKALGAEEIPPSEQKRYRLLRLDATGSVAAVRPPARG